MDCQHAIRLLVRVLMNTGKTDNPLPVRRQLTSCAGKPKEPRWKRFGRSKKACAARHMLRTVLERNSILITDVFGRKSEKLAVLRGGGQPV